MGKLSYIDLISIFSVIIAVIAAYISYRSAKSAYQLSCTEHELDKFKSKNDLRKEKLSWYLHVIDKMTLLRHAIEINDCDRFEMIKSVASLSALIEFGRFFYPNVPSKFGREKPTAHRGFRRTQLALLVAFYDIVRSDDAKKYVCALRKIEEHFTSILFDELDPIEFNKEAYDVVKTPEGEKGYLDMFLEEKPEMREVFVISHNCQRSSGKTLQWCNTSKP